MLVRVEKMRNVVCIDIVLTVLVYEATKGIPSADAQQLKLILHLSQHHVNLIHVDHIAYVETLEALMCVVANLAMWVPHHVVNLNVQSMKTVQVIRHVFLRNVLIHALVLVVRTQIVEL